MNEKHVIEKVSFYKLWLTFFVTMEASIVAWFFNNANKIELSKIIIVACTTALFAIVIAILTYKSRKMIKKLEEQK